MLDGGFYVFSCGSLFRTNLAEGDKEFIINGASIVVESSYGYLEVFDPILVKGWDGSGLFGVLDFGAVGDFGVFMGQELRIWEGGVDHAW